MIELIGRNVGHLEVATVDAPLGEVGGQHLVERRDRLWRARGRSGRGGRCRCRGGCGSRSRSRSRSRGRSGCGCHGAPRRDRVARAVVVEHAAECTGRHAEPRRRRRRLADRAGVVAGHRPHREHPELLHAGKVFKQLRVGDGEHLGEHVVDADHRRHAELVPAEALLVFGEQRRHLSVRRPCCRDRIRAH